MDTNRLTNGRLLHGVISLAGPMLASSLLANLQTLIDLFYVGWMGKEAQAALVVSGTVLMMMWPFLVGIAAGTVAVVSRHVGAGDAEGASYSAGQSLLVALFAGVLIGLVGAPFAADLSRLLGANPEVVALSVPYMRISLLTAFSVFLLFIGNTIMQSAGNAVVPAMIMLLANSINIALDPIFIFGLYGFPEMGVTGAAVATALSHIIAAIVGCARLWAGIGPIHVTPHHWRLRHAQAWQILKVGLPATGQLGSRSLMNLVLMRIVATAGTAATAAYGIGLRLHMIILLPCFSFGSAAATMMGQNLGARRPDRSARAVWLAAGITMSLMTVLGVIFYLLAPRLIGVFIQGNDSRAEVIGIGAQMLRVTAPSFIFTALAIVMGRALNGAGKTMATLGLTVASLWGVQVPLAVYLSDWWASHGKTADVNGVFWAMAIAASVHGLLMMTFFLRGTWRHKEV